MAGRGGGGVEVQGARQLRADLKAAGIGVEELREAHRQVAEQVLRAAAPYAPRRTGRLAQTVRASGTASKAQVKAGFGRVPYAGPIHWGWSTRAGNPRLKGGNIRANPWLFEAAQRTQTQYLQTYLTALEKLIADIEGAHTP
jgi:hypothetical protein